MYNHLTDEERDKRTVPPCHVFDEEMIRIRYNNKKIRRRYLVDEDSGIDANAEIAWAYDL